MMKLRDVLPLLRLQALILRGVDFLNLAMGLGLKLRSINLTHLLSWIRS